MKKAFLLRWTLTMLAVCFVGMSALLLAALHVISVEVRSACVSAQTEFEGDCVVALSQVAVSPDHSYQKRNRAIWALGEIGDSRAIPILENLSTGEPHPPHCNIKHGICEYGVSKSIQLCAGMNVVRYVWRWI
jgi:hypothetical protein